LWGGQGGDIKVKIKDDVTLFSSFEERFQILHAFCKWAPSQRTCFLQMGPFSIDLFFAHGF
jgi:hypothetical protein